MLHRTDCIPAAVADILTRLDQALAAKYRERYRGLVLYGSYARGDADAGSDVDLLLLLDGAVDPVREVLEIEGVKWPLALQSEHVLSVIPVSLQSYERADEPFLWQARREGMRAA